MGAKNPIKIDGWNHHTEDKREAKERSNNMQPIRTKEGRKLTFLTVGSYVIHNFFNVANMQIVKSNSNRRFRTNISRQHNLFLYSRS
jgi:hypothetical protein